MIVKMRIDDRLLHGQIAYSWRAALSYDAIVIASDEAANDETRKLIIKMATPSGVRLAVRNIESAATLLQNEKLKKLKVFVIVAKPKDAYRLYQLIDETPCLNIGGMQKEENKVAFSKAVFVSKEDIEYLDKINQDSIEMEVRQIPSESVKEYSSLRKKVKF